MAEVRIDAKANAVVTVRSTDAETFALGIYESDEDALEIILDIGAVGALTEALNFVMRHRNIGSDMYGPQLIRGGPYPAPPQPGGSTYVGHRAPPQPQHAVDPEAAEDCEF